MGSCTGSKPAACGWVGVPGCILGWLAVEVGLDLGARPWAMVTCSTMSWAVASNLKQVRQA